MSPNLRKCLRELVLISRVKDARIRNTLLKQISCDQAIYKALHEIAYNTVQRKLKLKPAQKKKLRPYKGYIKKLACYTKKKKEQRQLVQKGGFLLPLIPAVMALAEILT